MLTNGRLTSVKMLHYSKRKLKLPVKSIIILPFRIPVMMMNLIKEILHYSGKKVSNQSLVMKLLEHYLFERILFEELKC